MDPVAASESFLQQVGQKLVRTLLGSKDTEEKKQEVTKEEGKPNLPSQDVDTTAAVGETSVDPPDEKAVSVQENRDDAPTTHPPGPDMSERPHPGQTEHSILQERKTGICDSSQLTAADEEVTQIAVASAKPLKSPENRALQGDVQSEELHSDSQGSRNMPEDTTARDSAGPTGIEDKFMDKTQIQLQTKPKESLQDMSGETLSKDKTAHTSHQESEESVCTTQSPGADSSESSLAADAGTASIPLPRSCSDQPAGGKDEEKIVTLSGQLEEYDSYTVDLRDTDKTAFDSGVSSVSEEITSSRDTMSEDVQPSPPLAAKSDRPLQSDQKCQPSPNPDSHISIPDVQADVEDTEDLCKSVEKAVATETKATDIEIPVDTPGAEQESDISNRQEQSSCLQVGTKTTDTAAPVKKPEAVQETGASENLQKSFYSQAMTEATDATMPVDASQVVPEAPSNDNQEKPPCSHAGMKEADTAVVQNTTQAEQDSGAGDLTEKPPCSQAGTAISDFAMTVDSPQVLQDSPSGDIVERPSRSPAGMQETDSNIPADTPQAEQESGTGDIERESPRSQADAEVSDSMKPVYGPQALAEPGSDDIQERHPCFQAQVQDTDTGVTADTPQPEPEICTGEIPRDSPCPLAGIKATDTAMAVDTTRSNPESYPGELHEKPPHVEVETEETDTAIAVDTAGADQESSTEITHKKPPFCHEGTTETDTAMPTDTHQAVQETHVGEIHKKSSHPQAVGLSNTGTLKVEATNSTTLDNPRSFPKPAGRKIRKKSSRIKAGIQDTPVSADTHQTARDSDAGGVHEESLLPQARSEESDTPVSLDTSQADQDSGAGSNHEKSPHSHADAKTNESVVPAIPSSIQTETKEPDITMPVDASEADQERETVQAILNKIINRRWSSFEALPSLSQKHDILRQLYGKLMGNRVLVLLGEAGSGKTTAALLLAHYVSVWFGEEFDSYLFHGEDEYQPKSVTDPPSDSLIVIDDFLGKYDPDSHLYWNTVVPLLESMKEKAHKQTFLLLTSRTTIFQNLLSSEETNVRFFLDENQVTTITIDYRKMWKDICADVKLKTPDFENLPSIGFPLCCQLAPHLAPDVQTILFQQPRLALRRTVKTLMDSNDIARTALTLLAVTEDKLDMNIFTSLATLQESTCPEILDFLPKASSDKETPAQIVEFYRYCAFLFQVGKDAVSFRSEVIQEAVLVVLCDSHADVLAKYCSLKLLSQIALATSDNDTSDDAEKPALSDSAKKVFLSRFRQEMEDSDHFDVMLSPYFQHHLFVSMFESTVKEVGLLKQWTQKCSHGGLHFVFYAGAVPSVFRSALSELDKRNLWVVLQAILACCYWGYNSEIAALMKVWKNKTDLRKALKEATIRDIVTGNLPGLSRMEEPRWELTPLFPQDTLLVLAARRGNDAVVKTLAFRDMNMNSQGMLGRTALMHYSARGRRDMVEFLLGREADPMIRDYFDMTALMYALQRKQWDIPKKLLTTESCRAENTYLQTPVMFACSHEWSTEMIKTLIDKGADLLQKDKWGYTCLHYACLHGHTDIMEYLLKEKKVDMRGKTAFGHTPLSLAVTGPLRSELAKLLLNTEATKDAEDTEVINMVCRASDCSIMKTLLSACLQKENVKNFALLEASRYGNSEMVQYLLQSGADTATTSPIDGFTALHYACIGSSVDCCEILLKKIDPNVRSLIFASPLMYALEVGALDCVRLLLHRGAKLTSNSVRGSCLHHATVSNLCSVLDWCIKEHNMDVNFRNISGMTPLQVACARGKYYSVKYLLDNGADILKVDVKGDTCLHDAARSGHWDIVKLLEKVDPSLMNVPNKEGETPTQLLKTTAPTS